jgi:hypothetical protein
MSNQRHRLFIDKMPDPLRNLRENRAVGGLAANRENQAGDTQ